MSETQRAPWCPFPADEPCETPLCSLLLPTCTDAQTTHPNERADTSTEGAG